MVPGLSLQWSGRKGFRLRHRAGDEGGFRKRDSWTRQTVKGGVISENTEI
jgi:hypothetical protein